MNKSAGDIHDIVQQCVVGWKHAGAGAAVELPKPNGGVCQLIVPVPNPALAEILVGRLKRAVNAQLQEVAASSPIESEPA